MERDSFPWGWALAGAIAVCIVLAILPPRNSNNSQAKTAAVQPGGGSVSESSTTASHNQLHLLSDNRLILFPNQVYDCSGQGSCVTYNITTTTSTTLNQQGQRVQGDQTIYISPIDGKKFCQDPATGQMTAEACR